jgi:lysophospholipase L1-like esterase
MKKMWIITILVLASIIYLNRAYARVYNFITMAELTSPFMDKIVEVNPVDKKVNKNLTYLALGDSLTAGVGSSNYKQTFPYELAQSWADENGASVKLVNLGVPGAKTEDVIKDQLPQVSVFNPDIITLLIGINDLHDRVGKDVVAQNIEEIIKGIKKQSQAKIILLSLPYLGAGDLMYPPYQAYFDWQTEHYNEAVESVAQKYSAVVYIDLYTLTKEEFVSNKDFYSTDLFHPSASGYHFWSSVIYANSR